MEAGRQDRALQDFKHFPIVAKRGVTMAEGMNEEVREVCKASGAAFILGQ
jgi:hypothetical protein